MARIAEVTEWDSDGQFPELKDLLRGARSKGAVAVALRGKERAGPSGTKARKQGHPVMGTDALGNRDGGGRARNRGEEVQRASGDRSVPKKKRVLGSRDDNPLLRPITIPIRERRVRGASSNSSESAGTASKKKVLGKAKGKDLGLTVEVDDRIASENDDFGLENEGEALIEDFLDAGEEEPGTASRAQTLLAKQMERRLAVSAVVGSEEENLDLEAHCKDLPALDDSMSRERRQIPMQPLQNASGFKASRTKHPEATFHSLNFQARSVPIMIEDSEAEDGLNQIEAPGKLPKSKAPKSKKSQQPPSRAKCKYILTDTEEEDEIEDEYSDGMSDFIVSDNEPLEEDDSVVEVPPPATRSARRLFKGRRVRMSQSEDEGLDLNMANLKLDDAVFGHLGEELKPNHADDNGDSSSKLRTKSSGDAQPRGPASMKPPLKKKMEILLLSSDVEDPFTMRFSPSENMARKVSKETQFTTPPGSPILKPRTLPSPAKLPRIPTSPHRQSSDAFWSQEVVNDWNDEYSPRKNPKPMLKPFSSLGDGGFHFSPKKSPTKHDRLAKGAKKAFSQIKHELAESFLTELDEKITGGKIAEMASSTGGIQIIWSKKLNTTAGRANWKRETICSNNGSTPTYRHHAGIELAEKVIDDQDRLLNVIAHEFCHLANFMISNIRTNPHGKEFKAWASQVSRVFADRGIEVTTKHSYDIDYKYVWECENCGTLFKRHSKSIDPAKHRCGVCKSKLVQTKPAPRTGDGGKALSGYQAFVKENMARVREENPGSPQKEIMGLVGKRYQEFKATKLKEGSLSIMDVSSKEGTPVDDSGIVARKLESVDLTSS